MVEVSKDGDTVAFVQDWLMNSDYDPTQFDRGFAAAIDARSATLQAERDRYRVLVNEAFEFLGGVDGATEIRGRLLTALSDTPTVQS